MICSSCGAENKDTAVFCDNCGTGLKNTYAQTQQTYYAGVSAKGYPSQNEWTAYVGMISGILSVVCAFVNFAVPLLMLFGIFFCFVTGVGGIVLGAIGLKTNYKSMARAGIWCGIAGIVLEAAAVFIIWSMLAVLFTALKF